jgi:DNA-binding HxlR family transcriptional regulator
MVLLDLLSRRWALRLIWELRGGPLTFRALRTAAGDLSPTVLQTRLNELREARLVATSSSGYQLTALGHELLSTFLPLHEFAERWANQPTEADG